MDRAKGYEDCMATHMIEKEGKSDLLRDAIAILYTGQSPEVYIFDVTHREL